MIVLYGNASPNVLKIRIALEELGLCFNWRHINIWSGEQFSPLIAGLNPLCKVPILVEETPTGDAVLFESGAILLHLAERGEGRIMPGSLEERRDVVKWLFVQCANLGPMFGQFTHFSTHAPEDHYALRRYQGQVNRLYDVLEQRLEASAYLAGSSYSIADIATFPWIRLHERHVKALGPATARWFNAIAARPAVAKAVQFHVSTISPTDQRMRAEANSASLDALFPGRAVE